MHLSNYPLVSIITIHYQNVNLTSGLLESLNLITYPNIEIIVADNGSAQLNTIELKRKFPNIILVSVPENYGFSGGNNLCIMRARGKYVLLLNNDIEVAPNFLEPLVSKLELNPKIGAVSPKIRFFHEPTKIQYAGFSKLTHYTIRNKTIGFGEIDNGQYDIDYQTDSTHGAAMLIPISVIKEVGMMAYIYFLYYEELDWVVRIKKAGYQTWYVHNSLVYHKFSQTTGQNSTLKTYYLNRNRIMYIRRNLAGFRFITAMFYQLLIVTVRNISIFLLKGKFSHILSYLRAIKWHFDHLKDKHIHENPTL